MTPSSHGAVMTQSSSSNPWNSNARDLLKQLYADLESTDSGDYTFLSEGTLKFVQLFESPQQVGINDARTFEGWKKQE